MLTIIALNHNKDTENHVGKFYPSAHFTRVQRKVFAMRQMKARKRNRLVNETTFMYFRKRNPLPPVVGTHAYSRHREF